MKGLGKNKISFIKSLKLKKFRAEHGLFMAEGHKLVIDLLNSSLTIDTLIATEEWLKNLTGREGESIIAGTSVLKNVKEVIVAGDGEIDKVSLLTTPPQVIAITSIPEYVPDMAMLQSSLVLALDNISDPGNMGNIIRICAWFGIDDIVCSTDTVDAYNPKVVQSTMGAISRIKLHYLALENFLSEIAKNGKTTIYGTFLDGVNIYKADISANGIIVIGNESSGISKINEAMIGQKLTIPSFPGSFENPESLNVSAATAIICSEFRRRGIRH
ncbi:MAG: RNA methyltransferase [Bacteroidia bacterium]|nr:RNA methyltransferase [Bacteroidia bacterium]